MTSNFSDYEDLLNAYEARAKNTGNGKVERVDFDPQQAKKDRRMASKRSVKKSFSDTAHKRGQWAVTVTETDEEVKIPSHREVHHGRRIDTEFTDLSKSRFESEFDDILSSENREADIDKTTVFNSRDFSSPANTGGYSHISSQEPVVKKRAAVSNTEKKSGSKGKQRITDLLSDVRSRNLIIYFGILAVLIIICSIWSMSCVNDVLAMNRSDNAVTITISSKVDTDDVLKLLKKNKLIKNRLFCKVFASFRGFTDEYQTGVFYLRPDMGIEKMLYTLKSTSTTDETVKVTFPEGFSVYDIAQKLEDSKVCSAKVFLQTLRSYEFDYEWLDKSLINDDKKIEYLEGYLFPDTYEFFIDETPSSVIKTMLDNFDSKFTEKDRKRCEELNMSVDEIVTLASIIQKEAASSSQMGTISSILHNRLNNLSAYPKLECDSTTNYIENSATQLVDALKDSDSGVRTVSYYKDFYDTYSDEFAGLPQGAICCPGYDAIEAALYPDSTSYYYFVHDKSGNIYTASTFAEHEQNCSRINN